MSDVKWTKEQQAAIDTHDCNLLVAAAAGSGKTAVLVERIIKMITDKENPIDIDRLLVVTFTNAAAAEMRERIAEAISKEIHKSVEPSPSLQRQLTLLNKASITTIHSFCLEVIRNNFHKIDLDPGFRIADDTEMILLKQDTIDELFELKYEEENSDFKELVECYCNKRDDNALKDIILNIYNFSMSMPYPEKWLREKANLLKVDVDKIEDTLWAKVLLENIKNDIMSVEKTMASAINIINNSSEFQPYFDTFNNEYAAICDASNASKISIEEIKDKINAIKFGRLKSIRNCNDVDTKERLNSIRKDVKKKIEDVKKLIDSVFNQDEIDDIRNMHILISNMIELVVEFSQLFSLKKKERNTIDFNDFEHFCLEILIKKDEEGNEIVDEEGRLVPSDVAEVLRDKYDEILIDEYQDSNMVQEVILNLISKERQGNPNIFMVGDVKQSIYRFRQAKPELFLNKYNSYSTNEGDKYRKITLFKNFRSRKSVVDAVNYIFELIMSESVGELEYDEKEALNFGAYFGEESTVGGTIGGNVEIHLIENNQEEIEIEKTEQNENANDEDEEQGLSKIELEAIVVATRIKELMNEENNFMVLDKQTKEYRKVQYKDIVILLRSTAKWAPSFVEILKNNDIPVYADVGTGYFDTIEIKTMMALLQIVDNPRQDIPLLAVMRSPIGGFTPEDLIDIRTIDNRASFYEAMLDLINSDNSKSEEEHIIRKLKNFIEKLNKWRIKSIEMPIDEFIWYLYKETGYYGFIGAMNAGNQRQANLKILFQRAKQYETTSYKGLFNFINFINKLRKSSGDMGTAKTIGENENVVRIMSIHKSKGLEFPVVFVSAMGKKFNLMDLNKKLLLHHELGFGPEFIDTNRRITYPTLPKLAIRNKILIESLSEEMRILYVAFTRAKEKLILTGSVNKVVDYCKKHSNAVDNSSKKIPIYDVIKARNYYDWIIPCIMRHRDGKVLREKIELKIDGNSIHESNWDIRLWNKNDVILDTKEVTNEEVDVIKYIEECDRDYRKRSEEKQEVGLENFIEPTDYRELIDKRLDFKYKYNKSSELPTVITVTELKKRMNSESDVENGGQLYQKPLQIKPQFLEETKGLSAAEKGTAMHNVMQYLRLDENIDYNNVRAQINNLVIKEFITAEQGDTVNVGKIVKFFNSDLGKRILEADKRGKLYREKPFHIQIKSTEFNKNLPEEIYSKDKILLQGIIDCYFEEDDKIILVDYKSDYINEDNLPIVVDKYRVQIEYYAKALNTITNKQVSEKYLYLFGIDREISI